MFDGITYGAVHGSGYVSIDMSAIDGANINPPGQPVSANYFNDATRLALKKDINLKDMQAVEKAFNIKN